MKQHNSFLTNTLIIISAPIFLLIIFLVGAQNVNAASGVAVNSSTFPDQKFRSYVLSNFNTNTSDGKGNYLDYNEINEITTIDVTNLNIGNLQGIENFSELKELKCPHNSLTYLNLSNNTKLTNVECYSNPNLSYLFVSNCTNLTSLRCDNCSLTNLNLLYNPKLVTLNCRNNKLATLDLSKNTLLTELRCHQNNLQTLDLSTNSKLVYLSCYNNNLSTLSLKTNRELSTLLCFENNLTSLDVSSCKKLTELDCSNNKLKTLNLNSNPELKMLYCNNNNLEELYTNNNNKLEELYCYGNSIKTLKISSTGELKKKYDNSSRSTQTDKTVKCISNSIVILWTDSTTTIAAIKPTATVTTTVDEEAATAFVDRLYYCMFERDPDANKSTWVNGLVNKTMTGADVAKGFVLSSECIGYKYSDEVFVDKLYASFFDRKADSGKETWLKELKNGKSREFVLAGFTNSEEFTNLCNRYGIIRGTLTVSAQSQNKNNNNNKKFNTPNIRIDASNVNSAKLDEFVERLYTEALGRPSDPKGKKDWVEAIKKGQFDAGEVARIGFFSSDEYKDKNKSNEAFVHDAYRAFFGRNEDPDGYKMWVKGLNDNKYTREEVIEVGFGYSDEFINLLKSYGFRIY